MPIPCIIRKHRVEAAAIGSQGFEFGRCGRCGRDMIRSAATWRRIPKGFRIVWKNRAFSSSGLAPKSNTGLAEINTVRVAVRRHRSTRSMVSAINLAVMALRCLLWVSVERLRAWRAAPLLLSTSRARVVRLPSPRST